MKSMGSFLIKFVSLFVFVLSLVSYYFAPADFNYFFITWLFALFLINGYFSIRKDIADKFFFSFSVLYLISFFLVTFAYPMFIHESTLEILFMNFVNDKLIGKGTALCQLAFSSYVLGMGLVKIKIRENFKKLRVRDSFVNYLIIPILGFISLIVGFAIQGNVSGSINFDIGWSATLYLFFTIYAIIVIHFSGKQGRLYRRRFVLYILIAASGFLLLFVIQDRGIFINIVLVFLGVYSFYIKRISLYKTLCLLLVGVFALSIMADFRSKAGGVLGNLTEIGGNEVGSNWDRFSDLTSISRNIYEGYEYKQNFGYFKPERGIVILVTPIPFLPNLFNGLLFEKDEYNNTSDILSKYTIGKTGLDDDGGLGTNSVIDLYMSWGVFGVVSMNLLMGFVVSKSRNRMHYSLYYSIIYFTITSFAIYIPRATVFEPYRLIVWLLLFALLMRSKLK